MLIASAESGVSNLKKAYCLLSIFSKNEINTALKYPRFQIYFNSQLLSQVKVALNSNNKKNPCFEFNNWYTYLNLISISIEYLFVEMPYTFHQFRKQSFLISRHRVITQIDLFYIF